MEKLRSNIEEVTPVSDGEMAFIHSFFSLKKVRRYQYLVQEGDDVPYEYLALSGIYRVYYLADDGKEHIVKFAEENCWMSDYKAFFKHDRASMFIECMEAGEVLCLTLYGREQLSAELHKMEHFFKVRLTNEYVALEERVKQLLSNTARQRYEAFLKSHPGLLQRIPKKVVAAYLGVCRETLSRLYLSC
ncbi:Crp/Fnr family transcriptional regulator [Taibaiella helva]|uniref:Crp/Fnr family transcriptional regulator n=1 Tax=Taibaiella helva TaxID=2301235 RepID=UPI000E590D66|nr:Crp/Fnr family transcriptional regulator [Taibaiella helva]